MTHPLPLLLVEIVLPVLLCLVSLFRLRRRLRASRLDLSLLRITEADSNRYWFLALISMLLPVREGATWFAGHVGYLYDIEAARDDGICSAW